MAKMTNYFQMLVKYLHFKGRKKESKWTLNLIFQDDKITHLKFKS